MKNRTDTFIEECFLRSQKLNHAIAFSEKGKLTQRQEAYEILDIIIFQMKERFADVGKLQFIDLVNEKKIGKTYFEKSKEIIKELIQFYPFFNEEKLQNELYNIYCNDNKRLSPKELIKYLVSNGLNSVYSEVFKLLQLVLTISVTSASSERSMSALKRVKTYLRNTMSNV